MACASQILGSDTMQRQVGTNIKRKMRLGADRQGGVDASSCPLLYVLENFSGLELAHCSYPFFVPQ